MLTVRVRRGLAAATFLAVVAAGLAVSLTPAPAQQVKTVNNERTVPPELNAQDKADIWTLHFTFKDPRTMTVDVPGRGRKLVWYMWYQVYNDPANRGSKEPVTFIPEFELVTANGTRHFDEVLPAVQEQIRKFEDPTGRLDLKNSVTVSNKPIAPTPPESVPKAVTGVAIWSDVQEKASDTTQFTVFISGLSNGWSIDDSGVIRRKTLELGFRKVGDGRRTEANDLRWAEIARWRYRAADSDFKGSLPIPVRPFFDKDLPPEFGGPKAAPKEAPADR
jgi:hypothetical protein